jgi:hypothetical protein
MPHLLILAAAAVIYLGLTHRWPTGALVHVDGMPDNVQHPDPDDDTTIDQCDRPDRVPGVRVRRPRRPEGDL